MSLKFPAAVTCFAEAWQNHVKVGCNTVSMQLLVLSITVPLMPLLQMQWSSGFPLEKHV